MNLDQDQHAVGPDLSPNSLQRWSVNKSGPEQGICEARGNIGQDLIANCLIAKLRFLPVLSFSIWLHKRTVSIERVLLSTYNIYLVEK